MRTRCDLGRACGVALAGAAAAVTFAVPSAYALQGYSINTQTLVLPAHTFGSLAVPCQNPAQQVLGGGFESGGPAGQQYYATASFPGPTGWTVVLRNNSAAPVKVAGFAVCATGQELYQRLGSTYPLIAFATTATLVQCPAGRQLTSGGFQITGPALQPFYATRSAPNSNQDTWFADIRNNGSGGVDHTVIVCTKPNPGAAISTSSFIAPASGTSTATVACGSGRVMGGGFAVTGSLAGQFYATASRPASSTAWTVTVRNNGPLATATVYALCAP